MPTLFIPNLRTRLLHVLDAGDEAEAALLAGDLERVQIALADRASAIAGLPALHAAAPPQVTDLTRRLRRQGERLDLLVRQRLDHTASALSQASRTSAAHGHYAGASLARLDTAPRTASIAGS